MEEVVGKLVLMQSAGPEQEFELLKSSINIGRAQTNDIILDDARVSRSHARLEIKTNGAGGSISTRIVDLRSSNGTRVNGLQVEQAELFHGDTIILGSTTLRYETAQMSEEQAMTMIDTDAEMEHAIDREFLPVTINETSQPRLVIFTSEKTWEVSLEDLEGLTIGRTDENQLVIAHPKTSRRHAEISRKGGIFVLKDLNSTNGTWKDGEKVDQLILQDGDTFRIGGAQIVFKSGFQEESLTLADDNRMLKNNRRIVVFVPGTMGSELWLGKERLWPDVRTILRNPEIFRFPSDIPLEPRGIVDEVVIVPNLIKLDQYNRLGDYLVEELGYQRGVDFFEFAYDWRQDVRVSARKLANLIESLPANRPIILIGHSLGTMVSRYYIQRLGGKKRIERVIMMGGPHQGSLKILTSMLVAPEVLPFGIMGERLRQIVLSFETSYQIIPPYPLTINQAGSQINFLEDETWLDESLLPLLRKGREFRKEIGNRVGIPSISIFGYGLKTTSAINFERDSKGKISRLDYKASPNGDSTILEHSAVCDGSEIHPVQQYHGSLFVDNDVKMRLKLELTRPF
jgi:pSer/pThr/pTyr-binding forkhead associated (FHA) protein